MAKKKEDPLSLLAIKVISIIIVVVIVFFGASKLQAYSSKIQLQNIEIKNDSSTNKQLETKLDQVNGSLNAELEAKESNGQRVNELEQEKLRLEQELQKAKEQLQAKLDAQQRGNTAYAGAEKPVSGSKLEWLTASTIPASDWPVADWLITKESSWRPNAQNPKSTAYGLKQFLDGTWAGVGCEKKQAINNPVYQLNCGQKYVTARYGSWSAAKAFHQKHNWY